MAGRPAASTAFVGKTLATLSAAGRDTLINHDRAAEAAPPWWPPQLVNAARDHGGRLAAIRGGKSAGLVEKVLVLPEREATMGRKNLQEMQGGRILSLSPDILLSCHQNAGCSIWT